MYFTPMTPTSAYILGLMFADGCISRGQRGQWNVMFGNLIKQTTSLVCENLKLKKYIRRIKGNKKFYHGRISNQLLYKELNKLGCSPRKTFTIKAPNIPDEYIKPFLLGFFDGDGSISVNSSINSWKISIGIASLEFATWYKDWLTKNNIVFSEEVRKIKNGDFYNIVLCGWMGKQFLKILYKSVPIDIVMKYKYKRYLKMINEVTKAPDYTIWELDYINNNLDDYNKCDELIHNDSRNFGWIRTKQGLKRKIYDIKRLSKKQVNSTSSVAA